MFEDEIKKLKEQGLQRKIYMYSGVTNFSSNDYLGLSHDPLVLERVKEAIHKYGLGGTSSRLLSGTKNPHIILEDKLAYVLKKEAGLVFSSGYHANTGIIPALSDVGDMILVDELCHASILDGIRLSRARFTTFRHNDIDHLKKLLHEKRQKYTKVFIVTEGVFSMDGDFPPLKEMVSLAKLYDAITYVDEAHSFGLYGEGGYGIVTQLELNKEVDIIVGTLSKSLGSQGGFVVSSRAIRDLLVSKSRSFIYTTSLSPACAGGAQAALHLIPQMEDRRKRVIAESKKLRSELKNLGFDIFKSQSQIIPVWTGNVEHTKNLSDYLLSRGYLVPSIRPPTVPVGEGRIRFSVTFDVTPKVEGLIKAIAEYNQRPMKEKSLVVQSE